MVGLFKGLGVSVSNEVPVSETVQLSVEAEKAGLYGVWIPESYHHRSGYTAASAVASATEKLNIALGIINPYTRHPVLIAMETATLDELSRGRVILGLGTAIFTVKKYFFDPQKSLPFTRMRETVDIINRMLRGNESSYDGKVFKTVEGVKLDWKPHRNHIPIHFGAVNQGMLRLAAELVDGVQLGAHCSPGYVQFANEQIEIGLKAAGRSRRDFTLCGNILMSVDRDREAAIKAIPKEFFTYYLLRVERIVTEKAGVTEEQLESLREVAQKDGLSAAASQVSDELLFKMTVAGTPEDCIKGLQSYRGTGLDLPLAWFVLGPDPVNSVRLLGSDVLPHLT
jgi:5,10-methylenetetrahydromethanopterin reductase